MAASRGLFAAKDLTQGTPWKRIVEFAVPMLIGNIAQQLYNTADSIIVGRYIGDNALAAVGSAMPVLYLLLVLFAGIAVGAGVAVAQFFGARDREQLSRTIGTCITLTALSSAIIMVIGPAVSRPLLQFLNTPASIIDWCADYLNIFFLGIAGFSYYNIFAGILRGLGTRCRPGLPAGSHRPQCGFGHLVCVAVWPGVRRGPGHRPRPGISAALCFLKLRMTENFDLNWSMLKPSRELTLTIMKLGLPSGLTQAIFSLAMVAVQSLINSFGEMVIACNVIVMRVDGFAMMPNFSFGAAMTTFAGHNIGAGRMDRVRQGSKQGTLIAVGVSATITVLLLLFGRHLMNVFTDTPELVALSMRMMRILALGYVAVAVTQCLTGVMRGAGDAMTPMWISLIAAVLLRVPTAYGLAYLTRSALYPNGRPESPFISLLVSWTLGAVITAVIFKRGAWRQRMLTLERKRVAET